MKVVIPLAQPISIRSFKRRRVKTHFSQSDKSSDDMITGRVPVVEWLISQPVSQGIDTECSLLNKENAQNAGVDKASEIISPSKACNEAWEYHTHKDKYFEIMSMLPDNNRVFIKI